MKEKSKPVNSTEVIAGAMYLDVAVDEALLRLPTCNTQV